MQTDYARTDYYLLDELLTVEERDARDTTREFVDSELLPVVNDYWNRAEPPLELLPKLGKLGVVGGTVEGYGCPGLTATGAGLVAMELSRGDGGFSTLVGGNAYLAIETIGRLGSEEQKERWLPGLANMELLAAYALTEPTHGSDIVSMETSARLDGDEYVINGTKRWVGNGSIADITLVWARDDDGNVGGFVVDTESEGYSAEVLEGKAAVRTSWQTEIKFDGVRVPAENRLEFARDFRDTTRSLSSTRYIVAWNALGHAVACYEAALAYAKEREQFGKPIASFQIVQSKLAGMLADITTMQLMCLRLSRLADEDKMTPGMASLAKMDNARKARRVCLEARDILGGNGILLENHVARHAADMEALYTYEGTDTVQSLIVGRDITGISAFV